MPNPRRLSRRTVLKGAAGVAIALPWLEIMGRGRRARAAAMPANRFVAVYQPGGTILDQWTPTGTESAPVLSPILAPFEPMKSELLIFSGVDMKSAVGEQRQGGIIAWLTGSVQNNAFTGAPNRYSKDGPSLDQVLAPWLSAGKRKPSLYQAVRWGTGRCHGSAGSPEADWDTDCGGGFRWRALVGPTFHPEPPWRFTCGAGK